MNWNNFICAVNGCICKSLPTRERELKFLLPLPVKSFICVAPYTGAWIEISMFLSFAMTSAVAPYTGAWIEILSQTLQSFGFASRSLHGSVNWNSVELSVYSNCKSSLLHGSVNWNSVELSVYSNCKSSLLHGSVNWNYWFNSKTSNKRTSLPTRERELKFKKIGEIKW